MKILIENESFIFIGIFVQDLVIHYLLVKFKILIYPIILLKIKVDWNRRKSSLLFFFKGIMALTSCLQQRKLPLRSINLQSCSITHRSLLAFNTALIINSYLLKSVQILNLAGNRIKEDNVRFYLLKRKMNSNLCFFSV